MSKNSLKGRLTISVSGGRNLKVAQLIGEVRPHCACTERKRRVTHASDASQRDQHQRGEHEI